ncbi:MAG: hypothetical protein KC543_04670, partial [Myxococcales bacterium]|nr:hypothetical protein [Myxococcales bacterium]
TLTARGSEDARHGRRVRVQDAAGVGGAPALEPDAAVALFDAAGELVAIARPEDDATLRVVRGFRWT